MRFLFINFEYPPIGGGAGRVTQILAEEFAKLGHEITVLTSKYKDKTGVEQSGNITIYRVNALRKNFDRTSFIEMFSFLISSVFHLKKIIKKQSIDASVVFFSIPCGPLGIFIQYCFKIPYVISMHGMDVPGADKTLVNVHRIVRPIRRKILKESVANIAVSRSFKKQSESVDHIPVQYIPNGVRTNFFIPMSEYKKNDDKFRMIFVGRFHPVKNLKYLLFRLRELVDINNSFVLMMVGNGPLQDELKELATDLDLNDNIEWYSWVSQDELVKLYNKANCFVLLSLYEGMPLTALEAMSCGLPVVASKVLGNVEIVKPGENGYLFDLEKPEVFVSSIITLNENKELLSAFSKYSRKWMLKEFSWSKIANQYLKLFKSSN